MVYYVDLLGHGISRWSHGLLKGAKSLANASPKRDLAAAGEANVVYATAGPFVEELVTELPPAESLVPRKCTEVMYVVKTEQPLDESERPDMS